MPFKFFGFEFEFNKSSSKPGTQSPVPTGTTHSPVAPDTQDGALNVQYGAGGGYYGYYLDLDGTVVDDFSLINRYREMQLVAEVDEAIDQIINELVVQDDARMPVSLDTDYIDEKQLPEKTKIRLQAEFDNLLKLMRFHKDAYTIMRQWYIDGRLFYHLLVDEKHPENGIQELRLIDPRTIRKVREVARKRHEESQADIIEVVREYYVFNPMGFTAPNTGGGQIGTTSSMLQYNGVRLTTDAVAFCPSGLYDSTRKTVLSWLHKAIKPLNLLRMMEDSCVIYRVARAPERRVFYIDVGALPKQKAEEYITGIMQKHRNKLVYDVSTGELRDDRKFMSMLEDFWLPRKEGNKGTEIQTLPAGQNLSEMEDVDYFRRKLYRAMGLPPSRIDQGTGFSLGRSTEISRDELRFTKFIHRMQSQFTAMFDQLLERQLRLKNVLTEQEWHDIKDSLRYKWQQDSHFEELKNQDIMTARLTLLQQIDPYINRFFSEKQVARDILKYTNEEWATIRGEFKEEAPDPFGGDEPELDGNGEPIAPNAEFLPGENFDDEADEVLAATDNEGDEEDPSDDKDAKSPKKSKKPAKPVKSVKSSK
jgi:hypothetical protein